MSIFECIFKITPLLKINHLGKLGSPNYLEYLFLSLFNSLIRSLTTNQSCTFNFLCQHDKVRNGNIGSRGTACWFTLLWPFHWRRGWQFLSLFVLLDNINNFWVAFLNKTNLQVCKDDLEMTSTHLRRLADNRFGHLPAVLLCNAPAAAAYGWLPGGGVVTGWTTAPSKGVAGVALLKLKLKTRSVWFS